MKGALTAEKLAKNKEKSAVRVPVECFYQVVKLFCTTMDFVRKRKISEGDIGQI